MGVCRFGRPTESKSFPVGVIVSDHNSRLARFDLLWYCRQQDHPCRYFEVSCPFWPCYLVLNSEYRGFFGNNVFRWCYFFSCSENTQKFQFLNAQTISRVNIKCKCAEKSKCSMLLMLVSSDQNGVCQKNRLVSSDQFGNFGRSGATKETLWYL